jgi:hypothetical protein
VHNILDTIRNVSDLTRVVPNQHESISFSKSNLSSVSDTLKFSVQELTNPQSHAPLFAIGVKPITPTLFFDIDVEEFPEKDIVTEELDALFNNFMLPKIIFNDDAVKEIREYHSVYQRMEEFFKYKDRTFFYAGFAHFHHAIYQTKHGWHMVMPMPTWNRVQFSIFELKVIFPRSTYFITYKNLRLRISPKWDIKTGKEISPQPILYDSCPCYRESRIGNRESYRTYD